MDDFIVDDGDDVPEKVKYEMTVLVALFACPAEQRPTDRQVLNDISDFLSTNEENKKEERKTKKTVVGKRALRRSPRLMSLKSLKK